MPTKAKKRKKTPSTGWVVVLGNPFDGLSLYGNPETGRPFEVAPEAVEHGENLTYRTNDEYHVVEISYEEPQ